MNAPTKNRKAKDAKKTVESFTHDDANRVNIPTAEYEAVVRDEHKSPIQVAYERRNKDLDPQLIWRGKELSDDAVLNVNAPPLYIQEKVHPKVLIDDLQKQAEKGQSQQEGAIADLFADFNGLPDDEAKTEFYQHEAHWTNRMILGDSLQVMASLAEREALRGKVQCIYFDPPYGIKFNSNFQWSTTSRDVKDGRAEHITREPEQVKAFRDTWRDGIHSYLSYLRDRLVVAKDLLHESGSIFVQIGDENSHRVRSLMDEIFGEDNFISQINFKSMGALGQGDIPNVYDYIIWYAKDKPSMKFRPLYRLQDFEGDSEYKFVADACEPLGYRVLNKGEAHPKGNVGLFRRSTLTSSGYTPSCTFNFSYQNKEFKPFGKKSWRTNIEGVERLAKANRMFYLGKNLYFRRHATDAQLIQYENSWSDAPAAAEKIYVVQTAPKFIERCMLMVTDPGDLVLDPTCGSGTTAYVAEQWGRRWITVDTSRVSLALARARIMGAKYPFYLLADSRDGQIKEAELTRSAPSTTQASGNIRHGFVYERVPHITLKSIANNNEIDVIWARYSEKLDSIRGRVNADLNETWEEWEVPKEPNEDWPAQVKKLHREWLDVRNERHLELEASIASKANFEHLYDRPYEEKSKIRVAGPFTVESLSPHRILGVDENDELIDPLEKVSEQGGQDFASMVLENLKSAGVQQAHKEDKIEFTSLEPWPGNYICAEAQYFEGPEEDGNLRRAGIFIGPEFGTVQRADLVAAAREAADSGCDVLIACAFNFDAHSTEFEKLGRVPVLKARMNADLHMAEDLKNTGKGNLFVIFGEPDIDVLDAEDRKIQVRINGVDVFQPNTGKVVSDSTDGIACWFVDTDYNEESFFVRQAYFLGANDPYKSLKTTLKAQIDKEAWESLHSDTSRPFAKPRSGRIAVKAINHLGDEVMKVFRVD